MAGVFVCPGCGGKFRLGNFVTPGSKFRCPHCSRVISISGSPAPGAAPAAPLADEPLWSELPSAPADPLGPPRRRKQDRTLLYVVGGSAGALGLLLGAALFIALSAGRQVATDSPETSAAAPSEPARPEASAKTPQAPDAGGPANVATVSPQPAAVPQPAAPQAEPSETEVAANLDRSSAEPAAAESASAGSVAGQGDVAMAAAQRSSGIVDLLELIDPARDAIGSSWTKEGTSLRCPGGARWALVVPRPPPAGYRWTLVLEAAPNASIHLGLVVDGQQVMLVLDSYNRRISGLSLASGRTVDDNQTTHRSNGIFKSGSPTTIVCTVNRSSVQVNCDDKFRFTYRGPAKRLSLDHDVWRDLPAGRLAVAGCNNAGVRIDKMELVEIDPGVSIPYAGPPPSARGPGMAPPWADGGPWPPRPRMQPGESSPSSPKPASEGPPAALVSSPPVTSIPLEELPEAVRRSKESVCIIEHPLGSGTGFVVAENLVATNAHVVEDAYVEEIECHFSAAGLAKCRASRVLFEDPVRDLCLLEVKTDQAPIPIVADHVFKQGEKVVIVGNPALGKTDIVLRDAVTSGTIRARVHTDKCDFYQIDGKVDSGSSGGPAINYDGAVVAVIAMKATDRGETEIRHALRRLDDGFVARFGSFNRQGIAFGIPVADLGQAIAQVEQQPAAAVAAIGDRHLANVLLQRMLVCGGINLIKLQLNVPAGVRQQAEDVEWRIRMGRIPSSTLNKIQRIPLIPANAARQLSRDLEAPELLKIVRACETRMEANVKHLSESPQFDPAIARNFEALLRTVLQGKRYAENPPSTYNAYAKAVNDQAENLETQMRRLNEQLVVAKAAYED
ncbi:MAG: trypsin-like peptidase domain-containing protein [Pirellulales bacterium]|jgi:S1-C subfamily serine protease|nr:trypsin-like peptidase domain-containing protein [Thermoguttaceae bacterium]MDD4787187.1 trypsin-like peptidase domain-containing protein [Pirellulales bacterium]MDI9442937.1 trypsin-like peptidase domain-containing protein [Planctomycetota bacterium]NLY99220.1 trypsin-like serine protease [Pirellulaceae bacterium]